MPDATLVGLRSDVALARLFQLMGKGAAAADAIGAIQPADQSPESLARELDTQGIGCRLLHIHGGELRFLEQPALIQLRDNTWLLLHGRQGRNLVVETAHGRSKVSLRILQAESWGIALQILPELEATNVWRAIGARLLERQTVIGQVAGASALMTLLVLIPPQITRITIDRALPTGARSLVDLMALSLFLVTVFQAWTGWVRANAVIYVKTRTETALGRAFLGHVLSLPFAYLGRKTRGELLQGFAGIAAAQDLLTERVVAAALDGVAGVFYLVVMLASLPGPAVAVVLATAAMAALSVVIGRMQVRIQRKEIAAQIEERDFLVELLSGAAALKAAGAEERGVLQWLSRFKKVLTLAVRRQRLGLWSEVGLETISQSMMAVLLVWGGLVVLRGEAGAGALLAFLLMSTAFMASIVGIAGLYLSWVVLQPQLAAARDAIAIAPQRTSRVKPTASPAPVVIENVWFRYGPDRQWVLKDFHLHVGRGEKRWISGPSGFGKTTLLRLVAGLYEPERGTISLGGREPSAAARSMIYLPQSVHLYGGSILQNLRIFSGHAPRERLMEAARASGLHAVIGRLPMGYETILPPGGATLSGGERQLVVLSAVMASDRSLFLLDEAMANLDWVSRAWVEDSHWFDGKTVIYASHQGDFAKSRLPSTD
jgi:ABC-type bacteriocin/lantibiotic exporter with double-glycine peptidase domain